ncbi:MAG: peptidoglycan-binding domain-containing protein [Alphaproteobacteria bacterium]
MGRPRPAGWFGIAAGLLLPALSLLEVGPALAARVAAEFRPPLPSPMTEFPNPRLRRIQSLLHELRLYQGPQDGLPSGALTDAVRRYQSVAGRPVDGEAGGELLRALESGREVKLLLRQLDKTRTEQIETAREVLGTLEERTEPVAADIPFPRSCAGDEPGPEPLLAEAMAGLRTAPPSEMRDWALGEVAAAMASVGRADQARLVLRYISDPRAILATMGNIARSQAGAGAYVEAGLTAETIPDPSHRAVALARIAEILAERGQRSRSLSFAATAAAAASQLPEPAYTLLARLAGIAGRNGDTAWARAMFGAAAAGLAAEEGSRLAELALGLAEIDKPNEALTMIRALTEAADRDPVLVAVVQSFARRGDPERAWQAARIIDEARYRAVALADLAVLLAPRQPVRTIREILTAAEITRGEITLPYARSFAHSRIALAWGRVGDGVRASSEAAAIRDSALRADSLWQLSHFTTLSPSQRRLTRIQAEKASGKIIDPLMRARIQSRMAMDLRQEKNATDAGRMLRRALVSARTAAPSWQRARALALVVTAMGPGNDCRRLVP